MELLAISKPRSSFSRNLRLRSRKVKQLKSPRQLAESLRRKHKYSRPGFFDSQNSAGQICIPIPGLHQHAPGRRLNHILSGCESKLLLARLKQNRLPASGEKRFNRLLCFPRRFLRPMMECCLHVCLVPFSPGESRLNSDLQARLEVVESRIQTAVNRSGRPRDQVTLVAVTKVFPASAIRDAYELGLRDFGENYVQEFEGKAPEVKDLPGARFHFIGHLQSNKSKRASELFEVIQTVDSAKLAQRLSAAGKPIEVFLEVKLSEEQAKAGCSPEELPQVIAAAKDCPNIRLMGLMTMPPWTDDAEPSRPYFRRLAELARQHGLANLSMGMSHDFEVAIEEGATHIRIGTALFGRRVKK